MELSHDAAPFSRTSDFCYCSDERRNELGKKELTTKREYTREFKVETVRLAESIGGNAAASRFGVAQSTVTNWVRRTKGVEPAALVQSLTAKRPVSELEAAAAPGVGQCPSWIWTS